VGEGAIFTNGNLCPAFKQKMEGQSANCFQLKIILMSKWGGIFWSPSIVIYMLLKKNKD
jgi:hypothetical protein